MPIDGLRAWIGEVERKLGMRTRVFLVLATIAIGGAGAAIYLALDTRDDAVSESDVRELQERFEERIAAGGTTEAGAGLTELEAELNSLEAEVEQLRGSGQGKDGATDGSGGAGPGAGGAPGGVGGASNGTGGASGGVGGAAAPSGGAGGAASSEASDGGSEGRDQVAETSPDGPLEQVREQNERADETNRPADGR